MNHQPGHHGAHVCHKCGWTFPNPHPNAKHRRAHKKVCGKMEGFKILDSEESSDNNHPIVQQNELCDDDRKSPAPASGADGLKTDNRVEVEKQVSNRSEDEVFADAVSDFTDAGSSSMSEPIALGHPEDTDNAKPVVTVLHTPIANKSTQLSSPTSGDRFWSPDALSSSPEKIIQSAATLTETEKGSAGLLLTEDAETNSSANVFVGSMNVESCENFEVSEKECMPRTMTSSSTHMSECSEMGCSTVNEKDGLANTEVHSDLPPVSAIRLTTDPSEGAFVGLNDVEDHPGSVGHEGILTEPSLPQSMSTLFSSFRSGLIETELFSQISQDCIEIYPKHGADPEDKVPPGDILAQDLLEIGSEHGVNSKDKVPAGGILAQDCVELGLKHVVDLEGKVSDGVSDIKFETDTMALDSITSIAVESPESSPGLQKSLNEFSSSINSNVEVASCDSSALIEVLEGPQVDSAQVGGAVSQFAATESHLQEGLGQIKPESLFTSHSIEDAAQAPEGMAQVASAGQVAADEDMSKNNTIVGEVKGPTEPGVNVVSGALGEATEAEFEATVSVHVQEGIPKADGALGKEVKGESVNYDQNGATKDRKDDILEADSAAPTERATEDQKTTGESAASNDNTPLALVEDDVCKLDGALVKSLLEESVHDAQTCVNKDHTDEEGKADSGQTNGRAKDDKEATDSECVQSSKETALIQVKEDASKVEGTLGKSVQEVSDCSNQSDIVKDHVDAKSEIDPIIASEIPKDNEETAVSNGCLPSDFNSEVHEVSIDHGLAIPDFLHGAVKNTDAAQAPKRLDCAVKDVEVKQPFEIGTKNDREDQSTESEGDLICAGVGEPRETEIPSTDHIQGHAGEEDATTGPNVWDESLQKDHSSSSKDYVSENMASNLNGTTERTNEENETMVPAEYIGLTHLGSESHDAVHQKPQGDISNSVVRAPVPSGDEDKSTLSESNTSSEFVVKSSGTDVKCHRDVGAGESKVNPRPNDDIPLESIITSDGANSTSCFLSSVSDPCTHQHQLKDVSLENLQEVTFDNSMEPSVLETGIQVQDFMNEEFVTSKVHLDSGVQTAVTEDTSEDTRFSQEGFGGTTLKNSANASVVLSDASMDSMSQGDSVEGTWGSISASNLGTPKEEASAANTRTENNSEGQLDHYGVFEPPSFMTLVDPRQDIEKQQASSSTEIQLAENSQKPTSQAGWFPSVVHGSKDSPGRRKNEEIIAKVVNWSSGKPHTPLRSLLVEAHADKKHHQQTVQNLQEHEPAAQEFDDKSVGKPNSELAVEKRPNIKGVMETEWNSPARLPISKREKRKVRGKAYWVPFVCCSSVS